MEITIFGKQYLFGRKPKIPKRETTLVYAGEGYFSRSIDSRISKQMSAQCLRNFAENSPTVRRAINLIKNGILNCNWVIEKKDSSDETDYSQEIAMISRCLSEPNYTDTYNTLMNQVIEDMLVGDCGVIEIVEGTKDKPLWLYPVDGFSIEIGNNLIEKPTDIKYMQRRADGKEVKLAYQDLMYLKQLNRTYSMLGVSPVETAFNIINYLLETQKYAAGVTTRAVPKYLLDLGENITDTQLNAYRKYFDEEVYGTGKLGIIGGTKGAKSIPTAATDDSGLYITWQKFLTVIIAYTFNIDPKRFNEGSQTDRSTVDEQNENLLNEAIKPYAQVIETNINQKIIGRLGLSDKLVFKYVFTDTETRKKAKSNRIIDEFNADLLTLNEAREMLGYTKLENYGDYLKSQYKSELNIDYANRVTESAGGYNGVGKDRYGGD